MKLSINRNIIVVMIFFFSISVVMLGMVLKLDRLPQNTENRKLAELPSIKFEVNALELYPKKFTDYFNDHFGFRNTFVVINFFLRHNILRESPSSQVVSGKSGWYFYENERSIEDYRGITHFDDKKLRDMATSYENKRELLSRKGIRYILVLAPNKETIYGEWMPDSLYKIRNRSGLDEISEYLSGNTKVDFIDLRKTLFGNKNREQLYMKTHSSWNDYAAFLAYQEIMKTVAQRFPGARANPLTEFNIKREEIRGGDLAEMMGGADYLREWNVTLIPKTPRKARKVDMNPSATYREPISITLNNEKNELPRILVFRDCFFDKIIPFLSEHFQYSKYYWQSWNPDTPIADIISEVRPDVVIEEKVERFLKFPKSP